MDIIKRIGYYSPYHWCELHLDDDKKCSSTKGAWPCRGCISKMPTSPNAVSSQSDDDLYRVEPLTIKGEVTESIELFLKACDQVGNYTIYVRKSDYMHLIFTTKTMKYNDDVEIYIDEEAGLIHYRSGSRVGYSDMGLNRVRYNQIADYYESN